MATDRLNLVISISSRQSSQLCYTIYQGEIKYFVQTRDFWQRAGILRLNRAWRRVSCTICLPQRMGLARHVLVCRYAAFLIVVLVRQTLGRQQTQCLSISVKGSDQRRLCPYSTGFQSKVWCLLVSVNKEAESAHIYLSICLNFQEEKCRLIVYVCTVLYVSRLTRRLWRQ